MEFRILGPIELIDGDRLVAVGGPRQRALLAVLLVRANRLVPADQLVEELWDPVPPAAARTLQVYVSRLRKALGCASERLATRLGGYVLRVEPDELDAHRFERQLCAGRRALAAGDPESASRILRDALALWRGQALEDVRHEAFAQMEIGRLEELRMAALEERIDADLALARHREIVPELETLVAELPLRERTRCQLMLALYRSDRQADALAVGRDVRRHLNEQLGLDPSPSLRRLEQAILTQSVEPALPSGSLAVPLPSALRLIPSLPFVGRSAELESLRRVWEQALGGVQRLVLVEGEAGAGKTRLARELAFEAAAGGATVIYGACDPALSSPYQPFVEALEHVVNEVEPAVFEAAAGGRGGELRRLVPDLGGRVPGLREPVPGDPDTERYRLHAAMADLLDGLGRRCGVMLVLDDLHWADASTLLLLRHLARTTADARVLVVATFRADGGDQLGDALAELRRRERVVRVHLHGLGTEAVAELLHKLAPGAAGDELAQALSSATGGNAFLVGEMCRHIAVRASSSEARPSLMLAEAGVPESVHEVVNQRLSWLAPETRELLELLSLSGRALDVRVLREAATLGPRFASALEEGVGCGMLEEVPAACVGHRFRHDLLRHAVRDRMSGVQTAALHLRIAEALERAHGAEGRRAVSELAFHFRAGVAVGGTERAVKYALHAAEAASRSLSFLEAARQLEVALELGVPDRARRARAYCDLGTAQHRAGHPLQALENFAAAGRLAHALGDGATLADAAIGFETACWPPGLADPRAVPLLEQAESAIGEHDLSLRVRLLAHLSRALAYRSDHAAADLRWRQAVELARSIDDRRGLAVALFHAGWTRGSRSLAEVRAHMTEACELARKVGDETLYVEANAFLLTLLIEDFAIEAARSSLADLRAAAEQAGQPFYLHGALYTASTIAMCEGRLPEAEMLTERAHELSRQLDHPQAGVYGIQMFTIRREQDRLAEIAPLVKIIAGSGDDAWGPALAVLLAEIAEFDAARRQLARLARDDFAAVARGPLWLPGHAYLADACAAVGDASLAARLYRRLQPLAGQNVLVGQALACYGAVDRYLAALATTTGDWEAAGRHVRDALELNASLPVWLAHTHYECARLLSRRRSPAAAACNRALELARSMGLTALIRRIEALDASAQFNGLSARELDTLRLIARGLSNREIGGRLFISEHTAAKHVRSILSKTGCTNRTEAASYAYRNGLADAALSPLGKAD